MLRIQLELAPQLGNDSPQIFALTCSPHTPDTPQHLPVPEIGAAMLDQILEQVVLPRRELDLFATPPNTPLLKIDSQVTFAKQDFGTNQAARGVAQGHTDSRAKLIETKGLRHVVIGADIENLDLLHFVIRAGNRDDLDARPGPHVLADFQAADTWKLEVQQDDVWWPSVDDRK